MKRAIVIGNSLYTHNNGLVTLKSCELDVAETIKVLDKLGFEVIALLNENIKTMKRIIKAFVKSLEDGDVSLFFYSGHGVNMNGRGLIAASDTDIRNLKDTAFCINKYINAVKQRNTKFDLIFLDCCRNQLKEHYKGFEKRVHLKPEKNMFIGFATSDYCFSETGDDDEMSIFTQHWLNSIQQKDGNIYQVMQRVIRDVMDDTEGEQIPCFVSSLVETFYFN